MKAVFLDMDGVIIDSEAVRLDYLRRFLEEYGIYADKRDLLWQIGVNNHEISSKIVEQYNLPITPEQCEKEILHFTKGMYAEAKELKPYDGLTDFLRRARACGWKTGVVSSTACFGVLSVLNRFGLTSMFDLVIGGEFVRQFKPAPEAYLCAASFADVAPAECLVIEDSPVGVRAGKAAGMYVIGFTGSAVKQDVREAHEIAGDYRWLINWLAGQ